MQFLVWIALIAGALWLAGRAVLYLLSIAAIPAALLAAPFVAAMRPINAILGLTGSVEGVPVTTGPVEVYVLLHGLLGAFVGLSAHNMVRRRQPGGG